MFYYGAIPLSNILIYEIQSRMLSRKTSVPSMIAFHNRSDALYNKTTFIDIWHDTSSPLPDFTLKPHDKPASRRRPGW